MPTRYEIRVVNRWATWATVYINSAGRWRHRRRLRSTICARCVMMRGISRATPWGSRCGNSKSTVNTPPSPGTNIALGKPTTASSVEGSAHPSSNAVDGQKSTRWSSAFADPQWITVDLGGTFDISRVVLNWEAAYASGYALQISNDGVTWNTFRTVSKSSNGVDDLGVSAVGRYVRMFAFTRGTPWGVSLWEFEVYGSTCEFRPESRSHCDGNGVVHRKFELHAGQSDRRQSANEVVERLPPTASQS